MFGFSFNKLLFTVAVIVAVWYGFKWIGRLKDERAAEARRRVRGDHAAPPSARTGGVGETEEMVECSGCGDFVSARAAVNCGRAECPYPG